jgi:murein L,D-transpeptidase YafK
MQMVGYPIRRVIFWVSLMLVILAGISACQGGIDSVFPKAEAPIPERLVKKMKAKGMNAASPILIRIFKQESQLEVWKQRNNGRFGLLETYEICKWSGKLGPKFEEGDRQAPEGFYEVGKAQMNPLSDYYLSFNLGFPNRYDSANGRTGSHLMVHGACSSAGCYSMTDEFVGEIYALAREALNDGQEAFQVQAYPFRMTPENFAKHIDSPYFDFWKMLKEGHDHFEITRFPPKVDVCEKRYLFNRIEDEGSVFSARKDCPPVTMPRSLLTAYANLLKEENAAFQKALKREQVRAALKSKPFPEISIDTASLVAPGSEVLPPATPEPEVESVVAESEGEAVQESADNQINDQVPGNAADQAAVSDNPVAPGPEVADGTDSADALSPAEIETTPAILASDGMPVPLSRAR